MKKVLSLLAFFAITFSLSCFAEDVAIDGLNYRVYPDHTAKVLGRVRNSSYDINIPSTITSNGITYTVTAIDSGAFYGQSITSIVIPETVITVGRGAFVSCDKLPVEDNIVYAGTVAVGVKDKTLTSYKIKEGTRFISTHCFSSCSQATSIYIPESVIEISQSAFEYCGRLKRLHLPEGLRSLGSYAFKSCVNLAEINFPKGLTEFEEGVFRNTALQDIIIPEGVTSIGHQAFGENTHIKTLSIPKTVVNIETYAFREGEEIKNVYNYATEPQSIREVVFPGGIYWNATLHVPAESIEKYKTYRYWKDFRNIVPINE